MATQSYGQRIPEDVKIAAPNGVIMRPWLAFLDGLARRAGNVLVATVTTDPPNIAAGSAARIDVPVIGARMGDFAVASIAPNDPGISLAASVTAADVVTVWLRNNSAAAIDLPSGQLRVRVERNL